MRNLVLMNKALLSNWNWRFAIEKDVFGSKSSISNMVKRRGDGALGP